MAALIFPWERNFSAALRTLAFSKAMKDIMYHRIWERSQTQDTEWHSTGAAKSLWSLRLSRIEKSAGTLTCVKRACQRVNFRERPGNPAINCCGFYLSISKC